MKFCVEKQTKIEKVVYQARNYAPPSWFTQPSYQPRVVHKNSHNTWKKPRGKKVGILSDHPMFEIVDVAPKTTSPATTTASTAEIPVTTTRKPITSPQRLKFQFGAEKAARRKKYHDKLEKLETVLLFFYRPRIWFKIPKFDSKNFESCNNISAHN